MKTIIAWIWENKYWLVPSLLFIADIVVHLTPNKFDDKILDLIYRRRGGKST